ncbi:hypothetical protein, partial [Oceanobacillus saliphilus]|uniref:hypothetical protein n=1 Tax=Oceanobacillus saliphilus TaxID=2925834 RepID=UPI00201D7D29
MCHVIALDEDSAVGALGLELLVQVPDLRPVLRLHFGDGGAVCGFALAAGAEADVGVVPVLVG